MKSSGWAPRSWSSAWTAQQVAQTPLGTALISTTNGNPRPQGQPHTQGRVTWVASSQGCRTNDQHHPTKCGERFYNLFTVFQLNVSNVLCISGITIAVYVSPLAAAKLGPCVGRAEPVGAAGRLEGISKTLHTWLPSSDLIQGPPVRILLCMAPGFQLIQLPCSGPANSSRPLHTLLWDTCSWRHWKP